MLCKNWAKKETSGKKSFLECRDWEQKKQFWAMADRGSLRGGRKREQVKRRRKSAAVDEISLESSEEKVTESRALTMCSSVKQDRIKRGTG